MPFFPVRHGLIALGTLCLVGCVAGDPGASRPAADGMAVRVTTETVYLPWETSLLRAEAPYGVERYWWEPDTRRASGLRALRGVRLQNAYLSVLVLPELGGVIGRAVHKPSGDDLFYREGRVKTRGPYWDSGVKVLFPSSNHSIRTHGQPAAWRVGRRADGTAFVAMLMEFSRFGEEGDPGFNSRYSSLLLSIHVILAPGRGDVQVTCRLVNPAPWRQGRKLWVGAMFPRVHKPSGVHHGTGPPPPSAAGIILPTRWVSDNRLKNLREYDPAEGRVGDSQQEHNILNAWAMPYGFAGVWYPEAGVNRLRITDPSVVRGARFYFHGEGRYDELPPHNKQIHNLIELFGSFDTLSHICEGWIRPGRSLELSQRYALIRGIGKVDYANEAVAVHLAPDAAVPVVEAVTLYPVAKLAASWNGAALGAAQPCAPDRPARFDLPDGTGAGRLVLTADGAVIADQAFPLPMPDDPERREAIQSCYVDGRPETPSEFLATERFGLGDWGGYLHLLHALPVETVGLGRVELRAGLPGRAVETLRAATAAHPADGEGHYLLGVALLEQGKEEDAQPAFAAALAADSPYPAAHYFRALHHLFHDRPAEAIAALDRLHAAVPDHWEGRLLRAWALGQNDATRDAALRELGAMEATAPADVRVQAAINETATLAGEKGRARMAAEAFRRLVKGPGVWRRVREWRAATHGIYKPPRRLDIHPRHRKRKKAKK